jgi:hypothetical protein
MAPSSAALSQRNTAAFFVLALTIWTVVLAGSFYFAFLTFARSAANGPALSTSALELAAQAAVLAPRPCSSPTPQTRYPELKTWNRGPKDEDEERLRDVLAEAATHAPSAFPNTVIILLSNAGFHEMLINFLHFAGKVDPPVRNYVVFPLDALALQNVTEMNVRMFWPKNGQDFSPRARNFRSDAYNSIVMHKWVLAEQVMSLGFDPFVIDVDNVFVRNPFNFLQDYAKCDCAATTDSQSRHTLEEVEDRWEGQGHRVYINSGFVLWKNTKSSMNMIHEVLKSKLRTDDQDVFCRIIDRMMEAYEKAGKKNLVNVPAMLRHKQCSDLGGFKFSMLPPGLFGSQKMIFEGALWPDRQGFPPYVIHFGYLAGFFSKRQVMYQHGFYYRNLTSNSTDPNVPA